MRGVLEIPSAQFSVATRGLFGEGTARRLIRTRSAGPTLQVQAPAAIGYGFGLTIVAAGAVMLPSGLAMLLLSPLSGVLLNRWGGRPMLTAGAVVMAGAFVRRVFADGRVPLVVLGATLVGIGTALAFAAMPTLIMAAVPDTETASANGLNSLADHWVHRSAARLLPWPAP